MELAGRTAFGDVEETRQESGKGLAGTGRRENDHIAAGQRLTGGLDLMVEPVPAAIF